MTINNFQLIFEIVKFSYFNYNFFSFFDSFLIFRYEKREKERKLKEAEKTEKLKNKFENLVENFNKEYEEMLQAEKDYKKFTKV